MSDPLPWLSLSVGGTARYQNYSYIGQKNTFWTYSANFMATAQLWKGADLIFSTFYTDPSLFFNAQNIQTSRTHNLFAGTILQLNQNIGNNFSLSLGVGQPWEKYTVFKFESHSDEMGNIQTRTVSGRHLFFRLQYSFGRFKGYVPFNSRGIDNSDRRK